MGGRGREVAVEYETEGRLTSMLNEEAEDSERCKAQAHRGSGQGVGIELGDKNRSEVEEMSTQIHARVFVWTGTLGEKRFNPTPDRRADTFMGIVIQSTATCTPRRLNERH